MTQKIGGDPDQAVEPGTEDLYQALRDVLAPILL
jgi:hypothetical protein